MSGVLTLNSHVHATDEVGIKIDVDFVDSKYKQPMFRTERWTIVGALKSDGTSGSLQSLMTALEGAYKGQGTVYGNVTYTANGNTHTLNNSQSTSGIRVKGFGYTSGPWKMHTELSNRRAFYAVIQADYALDMEIVAYQEEVEQFGTFGPRFRFMPSLADGPEYQVLNTATSATFIQRGTLIKLASDPNANSSIFSSTFMHHEKTRIKRMAPQLLSTDGSSQVNLMRGIQWYYEAEFAVVPSLSFFEVPELIPPP
jgi:hypothetical protein